jgi:hypothetical protein
MDVPRGNGSGHPGGRHLDSKIATALDQRFGEGGYWKISF